MTVEPTQPYSLGQLLADWVAVPAALADLPVQGLALDSRAVQPGDVFLALRGGQRHGLDFLEAVQAAGAGAVLWEPPYSGALAAHAVDLPQLAVPGLRQHLGRIASRFYGEPSQRLPVIGVTGTDGKTSCVHLIAQALSHFSTAPCGILGTLGQGRYGTTQDSAHTTPDAVTVQQWLASLVAEGCAYAAMEVSSHALDQGRVNGVHFAVAVLTQLSRDHLDYHHTPEAYAAAKRRLFLDHQPRWAVLNLDDEFGQDLAIRRGLDAHLIGYGLGDRPPALEHLEHLEHFVWGQDLQLSPQGLHLAIHSSWGDGVLQAGLLGRFNAHNLLAALAVLLALDWPLAQALTQLSQTTPVVGRMERLGGAPGQPLAVVDYAHTPHALEQALLALREHGAARLVCVFGCGGDRDPGKRPLMGAIAERLADAVMVTDDNPRCEAPEQVTQAILAGMQHPETVRVIHDRRAAIETALAQAGPDDIVLIAGKGHEDYQIIGDQRRPFSDQAVIRAYLRASRPTTEAA